MSTVATASSPAYDIEATLDAMLISGELKFKIACADHDDAQKLRQRMNHLRRMDRRKSLRQQIADKVPASQIVERSLYDKMVFEIPAGAAYVLIHVESGPGLQNQLTVISDDGSERPFKPAPDADAVDFRPSIDTSERDFDL